MTEKPRQSVVPDLSKDVIEFEGVVGYRRQSRASAPLLYYVAEHDRGEGVSMDELAREFGMSAYQQGTLALAMKDAVKKGYAEVVSPRGDPFCWRITEEGWGALDIEPVAAEAPDPEELKAYMREMHGTTGAQALASMELDERERKELGSGEDRS